MCGAIAGDGRGVAGDPESGRCLCGVGPGLSGGASGVHAGRCKGAAGADTGETAGTDGGKRGGVDLPGS